MEPSFKVILTPFGEDSLFDLRNFIFSQSGDSEAADRVIRRVIAYAGNLAFNPFMGRILFEYNLKAKDVRRITEKKRYNIYSQVNEQFQEVYILKIVDGKQSIDHQLHG